MRLHNSSRKACSRRGRCQWAAWPPGSCVSARGARSPSLAPYLRSRPNLSLQTVRFGSGFRVSLCHGCGEIPAPRVCCLFCVRLLFKGCSVLFSENVASCLVLLFFPLGGNPYGADIQTSELSRHTLHLLLLCAALPCNAPRLLVLPVK